MLVDDGVRHVVILGGGSAGWLTASLLAAEHRSRAPDGLRVTLIESPATPPIGVGEGTWPSMRDTLRRIGLSETALVRDCDAAFKQGSRFDGWIAGAPGAQGDRYRHPFSLPRGWGETDLVAGWLQRQGQRPFADVVSAQPALCEAGLAPKQFATPEFAAVANHGYHFDAGKFGLMLRAHATTALGVRHVSDEMTEVIPHPDGDIAALRTRAHGDIAGDLFIDCTGLAALLIGRHYGVGLVSHQPVLFNDRALAVQVPYDQADAPVACETIATARPAGWIWDIGLPTRRGVGHVFSSAHCSEDEAQAGLRAHIAATGGPRELPIEPRLIRYEPGHRQHFWHRNCVAVGLSSGFIEPLEASALALVEMSAQAISDELPATRGAMELVAARFNDAFAYRWGRVIDFLKLHYVLSRRDDSAYWREHRDPALWPERLRELLTLWQHRAPLRSDFFRIDEVFPAASYQYVLCGMGWRPEPTARTRSSAIGQAAQGHFDEVARLTQRLRAGLPTHRALLEHIRTRGLPRL